MNHPRSVTFTGIPSGDCECFCWDVTPQEYERVTGKKPDKKLPFEAKMMRQGGRARLVRLYPGDVLESLGVDTLGKDSRVTLTVTVEGGSS